jgi:hypothetical protein
MKNTTEKELDVLASLPLIHSIHDGLRSYEGTRLVKPRPCLHCGQTDYHKHDTRPRTFAVLGDEDGFEEVTVSVQRYWCKRCEQPVDSDISELFYEDCLYGKPIVDLCLYHAAKNPFNRVERILHTHYGIQVDRDTVQRYAELFAERVQDRHRVTIADEPLSLNFLSLLFGTSTADEFREEYADELHSADVTGLVGVADETYPSKKGAKKALREENARRKAAGERKKPYPEGFCVASAYSHSWIVLRASSVAIPTSRGCWQPRSSHRLRELITSCPMVIPPTTGRLLTTSGVSSTNCDSSSVRTSCRNSQTER